jgi:hypothetical protein
MILRSFAVPGWKRDARPWAESLPPASRATSTATSSSTISFAPMCRLRLPSEPLLAMLEGFSRRMAAYAIRRRPVGDLPDYRPVALARLIEGAEAANEQDHAGKRRRARKHHPQQAGEQDHGKTTAASEPSSTKSPRTGRKITLKLVTAMPPRCGSGAAARPRLGQNSRTTGRCR